MTRRAPIRLDEIRASDGSLVQTVTTEEERNPAGAVQELRANLRDPMQG